MLRTAFFLFFLFLACISNSQSRVIQEIKDSNKVQLGLYFYPSTLRMLNIQKDTAYDRLIKDVDKLSLLMLRPNVFETSDYLAFSDRLISEEQFEEYMVWDGPDYELLVLGKPAYQQMIGITGYGDRYYIFDLKGSINLMKLPDLYENITTRDSTMQTGFSYIFDLFKQSEDNRQRREQWRKEAEENRRKKEAENKIKKDSLPARDSLLLKNL